jgi:hypothetical protein
MGVKETAFLQFDYIVGHAFIHNRIAEVSDKYKET